MGMFADKERGVTAGILRECLSYNRETGEFEWAAKAHPLSPVKAGQAAGFQCKRSGYIRVKVLGHVYLAHRLAWLYVHGEWPKESIDHVNGNKSDNRISNLREATHSENKSNGLPYKKKLPLPKGVLVVGTKFGAQIRHNNKRIYLGSFENPQLAHERYLAEARVLHGEFFRNPERAAA